MNIRTMDARDLPGVMALWNGSVARGEVVYYPLDEAYFRKKFLDSPNYAQDLSLVAEDGGVVLGFLNAIAQKQFLQKETNENTPGYLTCFFVRPDHRGQGIGRALVQEAEARLKALGKSMLSMSGGNPVKLDWTIPGTPGHDHNNAPGCDMDSPGFLFLTRLGFDNRHEEIAMYLDLSQYRQPAGVLEKRARLQSEGISIGRYDTRLGYEFDGMCDRVGSEYWRKVLQDETAKAEPRVILAATVPGHIVAFTGPVDRQESGRGWFTGICTDPLYEGRGIATVLFDFLMQEFIKKGASFSTLFTGADNHARKIYERAGFTVRRRFAVMEKPIN